MKKHDDYLSGPHHYWPHFFAGLGFGGLLGWWIVSGWTDSLLAQAVVTALIAVAVACFAGRWGEVAWSSLADWLKHWWETIWKLF